MANEIGQKFAPGGCYWLATPDGVRIDGDAPAGTPGPPDTVNRVRAWFGPAVAAASARYNVPEALLLAIACTESAGGQRDRDLVRKARREEPGFVSDDATPGRVSAGCCQTLLSTARSALLDPGLTCAHLCDPATSFLAAAAYVKSTAHVHAFDPVLAAAAYNSGGLYVDRSPANRWKLRCYPLGTGTYIDRFVAWYNDATAVLKAPGA